MTYEVLDTFSVGENTAVTIDGNGKWLKNGISITTPEGLSFVLLSVGMVSGIANENINKSTTFLVKGKFDAKTFEA